MASLSPAKGTPAVSPRKRSRDDNLDYDVSQIDATYDNITVHGVVTELSPIKVSKRNEAVKYFSAKLSDGVKCMRVVSFTPNIHNVLDSAHCKEQAISITNCQVKEISPQYKTANDDFEIIASSPPP